MRWLWRTFWGLTGLLIVLVIGLMIILRFSSYDGGVSWPYVPDLWSNNATDADPTTVELLTPQPRRAAVQTTPGQRIFFIAPEASEARFTIEELLFGVPTTVVGRTSKVEGTVLVDLEQPARTRLSAIHVDASDLQTDDEFRNRSLRSTILQSVEDQYRFITFVPETIIGLPDEAVRVPLDGEPFILQMTGMLTIRGLSQTVTFEVSVTPVSATELHGQGMTTIQRGDFNLTIPSVPGVAHVSEEVELVIEFVAFAAQE